MQEATFVVQTWHFLSPILFSGLRLWNCEHCYLCLLRLVHNTRLCGVYYLCVHDCDMWRILPLSMSVICDAYYLCVQFCDIWYYLCPCLWYVVCITCVSMSVICGLYYLCVLVYDTWCVLPECQWQWYLVCYLLCLWFMWCVLPVCPCVWHLKCDTCMSM